MKKLLSVLMACLTAVGLLGCSRTGHGEGETIAIELVPGRELYCIAESEEQAQEIAGAYGIELVRYENSIAEFHTEEDPFEVAARGEKEGLPIISLNMVYQLDDGENLNTGDRKFPEKENNSGK